MRRQIKFKENKNKKYKKNWWALNIRSPIWINEGSVDEWMMPFLLCFSVHSLRFVTAAAAVVPSSSCLFNSVIPWLPWLVPVPVPVSRILIGSGNRSYTLRLGLDPWYLVRSRDLECQAKSVWWWWLGANLFLRPTATGTRFPMGTRLDGTEQVQICISVDWSGNHLWRSCAICINHFPMGSERRERRRVWGEEQK